MAIPRMAVFIFCSAPGLILALVALDERKGIVVVDGLEILRITLVPYDTIIAIQPNCHISDDILYELGIFVGFLGNIFLIRAFEHRKDLR